MFIVVTSPTAPVAPSATSTRLWVPLQFTQRPRSLGSRSYLWDLQLRERPQPPPQRPVTSVISIGCAITPLVVVDCSQYMRPGCLSLLANFVANWPRKFAC